MNTEQETKTGYSNMVRFLAGAALLVVMTVLVYWPTLRGQFIWDDITHIKQDHRLSSPDGLGSIWTEIAAIWSGDEKIEYKHQYYPLTTTIWRLQYSLWGWQTIGYHGVNILLHAMNAVLLWRLLCRLRMPGSWAAAAIFAIHPFHVQSVAWIVELKNVLSMVFFLSSALAITNVFGFSQTQHAKSSQRTLLVRCIWYAAALFLFGCALLSKTATAFLPIALFLVLWWKRNRLNPLEVVALTPMLLIGIVFVAATSYFESRFSAAVDPDFANNWLEKCLIAGRSIGFYAGKLLWPDTFIPIYPRWQIDPGQWEQFIYPIGGLVVLALLWVLRRRIGKAPFTAIAYFVLALVPSSFANIAFHRFSYVADHWQYWASIGPIALIASVGAVAASRFPRWNRPLTGVVLTLVLLTLAIQTWRQTHIYQTPETFWRHVVVNNPNAWVAHNNLGRFLELEQNEIDQAVHHYQLAIELNPNYIQAYNNLGVAMNRRNRPDQAIKHFRRALEIDRTYANAHYNLGVTLLNRKKPTQAIRHFRRAWRERPHMAQAPYHIGLALLEQENLADAAKYFRWALKINPKFAEAQQALDRTIRNQSQQPNRKAPSRSSNRP